MDEYVKILLDILLKILLDILLKILRDLRHQTNNILYIFDIFDILNHDHK